jgi:hypothetical protein
MIGVRTAPSNRNYPLTTSKRSGTLLYNQGEKRLWQKSELLN